MLPYSDTVIWTSTSLLWHFQVWWPNECYCWRLPWIPPFNLLMTLIAVSYLLEISTQILFWESKPDWTPQWGEGEQLWSDWKCFAGQENHFPPLSETIASTDQKVALQLLLCHREDSYHFPLTMCSVFSLISHIPLARGALHSQQSKLNHHGSISTQPKLIHMFKIYIAQQNVKWVRLLFLFFKEVLVSQFFFLLCNCSKC